MSESKKPLWKKVTSGSLRPFANRKLVYRPGQKERFAYDEIKHVLKDFELVENGTGEFKVDIDKLLAGSTDLGKVSRRESAKKAVDRSVGEKKPVLKRVKKKVKMSEDSGESMDEVDLVFEVKPSEDSESDDLFDVFSSEGKKMNESPLELEDAEALKASLEEPSE